MIIILLSLFGKIHIKQKRINHKENHKQNHSTPKSINSTSMFKTHLCTHRNFTSNYLHVVVNGEGYGVKKKQTSTVLVIRSFSQMLSV